ncbi:MAG: hypothetical protein LW850_17850 [Planctomycetaceae bacterium]|jgi:hypothetical protein|nr:hypothetical protein [Planctomycetaceae bacterium]
MAKRIVSYSLYGTNDLYVQGALRNVRLVPKIYPGWTPRVYVSQEVQQDTIDALLAEGAEVVRKERQGLIDGMFWRFLPVGDPSVDAVIIRDTDSRPTIREALAVEQWLDSGRTLHLMRDHPEHQVVIMGGMWGCKGGAVGDIQDLIDRWGVWARKGQDQVFLREVIYPRFENDLLVHSELFSYGNEFCLPFPIPRPLGEFVGAVVLPDRDTLTEQQIQENSKRFEGLEHQHLPRPSRRPWIKPLMLTKQWIRSRLPNRTGA